ncbi:MAG: porin family protein [Bergeyella zoohelcum]|nr:porin family protein [Bergeyella zoohelcum]
MKKLILSAVLMASMSVSGQVDFNNTRFGIIGGYDYSRVRNAHNPSGPRHTFQAGVTALIPIDSYDQFYIQPEVVYYGAGESGKDKTAKGKNGYNAMYANNYISVPIYFKGYFSEAESEFFGLIGPRFNFLINQKLSNIYNPGYTIEGNGKINGKAAFFNFAIGAGVGFSYKRKLEISGRYDLGISNTYPGLMAEYEAKKSQQVASVVINYIFD